MKRICLDACIIIYIVEKHPVYSSPIENLIGNLTDSQLCYSPLARLECFVKPFKTKDLHLKNLYQSFFDAQKILLISNAVFDEAAKLRADFPSLKTPDAIHIAVAAHYNCDEFWTNDNRLDIINPILVKNILAT